MLFRSFVIPSLDEGFGLAAIEAMSQGIAVVASNVGGLREIVAHGENGILVPPGNPATLACEIQGLLENPARRILIAQRGYATAKARYSEREMVERIGEVYVRLLERT